jgi:DNA-binding response OmpR family regulator
MYGQPSLSRSIRWCVILLLVEDDPVVARGITWGLTDRGHQVHHTDLGRAAIGLIGHLAPHAVIIDVSLPDIDGVTLGNMVRRTWPELPVVFATGHDEFEALREAASERRSAYLQKPFSIDELERVIHGLIGK